MHPTLTTLVFGIPVIYGIWYFMKTHNIATFMGFPTYGNGPFEKIGIHTNVPQLIGFFLVCVLECICGWGLWSGDKGSAVLSLAIIPVELLFCIGFALPIGPPLIVIRTVLIFLSWYVIHLRIKSDHAQLLVPEPKWSWKRAVTFKIYTPNRLVLFLYKHYKLINA